MRKKLIVLLLTIFMLATMTAADAEIIRNLDFFESMDLVENSEVLGAEELSKKSGNLAEKEDEE
jgi:hypothetical protein